MAYVPGTPTSLTGMNATALRRVAYEKKLREEHVRPSVFRQLKTAIKMVDGIINVLSKGIFLEVGLPPESGQSCRVAMRKPMRKAPQYGPANAILGNEDEQDLLWTELYYNEVKKGVKFKKWGYDYNDTAYLKFVETYGPALLEYMDELWDLRAHQALMLTYADELVEAPVSMAQQWNKNWCIPNLDESSMPVWDNTALTNTAGAIDSENWYPDRTFSGATTFVENVAAAMMTAAGTGSTSKATMTVEALSLISYYLPNVLLMDPLELDGMPTYILLVPSRVKAFMMNPNRAGSLGEYFQDVAQYKDPKRATLVGEIGRIFENLVCVTNPRGPTIVVSGAAGSYTMKPGFVRPGNNDDRNSSPWANTSGATNYVFDICIALGSNALAQYLVDPMKTDLAEATEYGQIQGRAAYLGEGLQIPAWDKDSGSRLDGASTTQIQRGSCIIPVSRTPIVTVT